MDFIKKNKNIVIVIITFILGFIVAPNGISEEELNSVKNEKTKVESELETASGTIKDLESKVKEAEPFFALQSAEKEAMKIEAAKKEEEVKQEAARIEEEQRLAALEERTVSLGNGTYLVGKDIQEGVYDLFATKGGGNVQSSDFKVNVIMGVKGDESFYQREQQNVALREGTTIDLKNVTIKFVPDDEYVLTN